MITAAAPVRPGWIRASKRYAIYARDGWRCVYCGRGPSVTHALLDTAHVAAILSLDHVIPRSMGGENVSYNLVTACRRCNRMKGVKTVGEFAPDKLEYVMAQCFTPIDIGQGLLLARCIRAGGVVIRPVIAPYVGR